MTVYALTLSIHLSIHLCINLSIYLPICLEQVVSLLKLGDWDPDVFFKFRDVILNHAPGCGQKLKNDLCRGVPRVRANYYLMDADKDISFEIGRFYYGIRDYANGTATTTLCPSSCLYVCMPNSSYPALLYYKESEDTVGQHHVTFHNQGLCHYSLGRLQAALDLFQRAHALNRDYEKARCAAPHTSALPRAR